MEGGDGGERGRDRKSTKFERFRFVDNAPQFLYPPWSANLVWFRASPIDSLSFLCHLSRNFYPHTYVLSVFGFLGVHIPFVRLFRLIFTRLPLAFFCCCCFFSFNCCMRWRITRSLHSTYRLIGAKWTSTLTTHGGQKKAEWNYALSERLISNAKRIHN